MEVGRGRVRVRYSKYTLPTFLIILAKPANVQIYKSNCRHNMLNVYYNIPGIICHHYDMYNKPILHPSPVFHHVFFSFYVLILLAKRCRDGALYNIIYSPSL